MKIPRLKSPELKMPKLKSPQLKSPQLKTPGFMKTPPVQPPGVVQDLWRDLRDKRLLPVVVLLFVATLAVPILVGGGEEPPPTGTGADIGAIAGGGSETPEAEPVVVAYVPGIRDEEERLRAFKARNPFAQQYAGPSKSAVKELEQAEAQTVEATAAAEETGIAAEEAVRAEIASTTDSGSSGGGGNGGSGNGGKAVLFTWEVDVKIGPIGEAKKLKGVKQGEFLPGLKRPVVMFVSANADKGEALFYVSRDVSSTSGDGRCLPNRQACEFLLLKTGQQHRLEYEPEGRAYRLKLSKVELKKERVDPSELSADEIRDRYSSYADIVERIRG